MCHDTQLPFGNGMFHHQPLLTFPFLITKYKNCNKIIIVTMDMFHYLTLTHIGKEGHSLKMIKNDSTKLICGRSK